MKKSKFEEVSFFIYRYIQQTAIHYHRYVCWIFHIPVGQCSGTPSTRNSCFTFSRDTGLHTTTVMATEQPWSESGGLSRVERTGAASVSHTHSWHQSPQDTSGWRVAEVWSENHWLGDQPAASEVMHSTKRRTLWAQAVKQ